MLKFLYLASCVLSVRANYADHFAANFKKLNPTKPLPPDIQGCDWCQAKVGEKIVVKPAMDAFHDTGLEKHLRKHHISEVVVCGLLTSVCVLFTAQSAFACGLGVMLYEPACGDRTIERHNESLEHYSGYLYQRVNKLNQFFPLELCDLEDSDASDN